MKYEKPEVKRQIDLMASLGNGRGSGEVPEIVSEVG